MNKSLEHSVFSPFAYFILCRIYHSVYFSHRRYLVIYYYCRIVYASVEGYQPLVSNIVTSYHGSVPVPHFSYCISQSFRG